MTAAAHQDPRCATSYAIARQRKLRRALETYGVLTRDHLREVVHPDGWEVPFGVALDRAVDSGRVRRLTDELYEAGPKH